jgi:hypothetical protein
MVVDDYMPDGPHDFEPWYLQEVLLKPFKDIKPFKLQKSDYVSGSATSSHTRREGGNLADLAARGIEWPAMAAWSLESLRDSYQSKKNNGRLTVIYELGLKTRIPTKCDSDFVAAGSTYKRALFSKYFLQKKYKCWSQSFLDSDMRTIKFSIRPDRKRKAFSADFSKATDLLKHKFLMDLCLRLGIPPDLVFDGHTVEGMLLTVGSFMGLPVSWSLLEIAVFLCAFAVDRSYSFRIKGDDLLSYWTKRQISMFITLAKSIGLHVNDKTIVAKSYATFAEADYSVMESPSGCRVIFTRLPTFSNRVFMEGTIPDEKFWMSAWERQVPRKLLRNLCFLYCKNAIGFARKYKIPLYDPRAIGGLGMPSEIGSKVSKKGLGVIQALNNGFSPYVESTRELPEEGWSTTTLEKFRECEWEYRKGVPYDTKEYEDALGKDLTDAIWADVLEGVPFPKKKELSISKQMKQLSRFTGRLLRNKLDIRGRETTVESARTFVSCLHPNLEGIGVQVAKLASNKSA